MMLPHGYEGAGPEHSSGRIERFLQLCADYNMQVCVPATPVQMYYLLRRQMVRPYRRPLIIFSPKSLLRHKESVSPLEEFANDRFHAVNEEWDDTIDPSQVRRVVFCSGKVFYDLRAARGSVVSPTFRWFALRSSIRLRTTSSRRKSRSTAKPPRSCGVRKNRATRAHGIAYNIICCVICCRIRS
jgi:2-oxoglutarate dehydrogenase complex dehydrogenase (E1) component-like enzyme